RYHEILVGVPGGAVEIEGPARRIDVDRELDGTIEVADVVRRLELVVPVDQVPVRKLAGGAGEEERVVGDVPGVDAREGGAGVAPHARDTRDRLRHELRLDGIPDDGV